MRNHLNAPVMLKFMVKLQCVLEKLQMARKNKEVITPEKSLCEIKRLE